jgi:hypothetical protein
MVATLTTFDPNGELAITDARPLANWYLIKHRLSLNRIQAPTDQTQQGGGPECGCLSGDYGTAHGCAQSRTARSVRLTPAAVAVIVTRAAVTIVVPALATTIPAVRAAAIPARTTVVTVEAVRVAAPNRVPEVTWTPLRERPWLGLGDGSRP